MIITAVRKYLSTLINVMAWKVALALGLMICLSLMEGISLLMLVPLLQLVGLDVQQGSIGRLAEFVSSFFSALGLRPTLIAVLAIYVVIVIIHSLLRRWETSTSLILEHEFVVRLRQRLYHDIAHTSWLFFVRKRASDFTHALTTEMERIGSATYSLLNCLATAIVAVVYILLAMKLSAVMTGLVFLCGGGLIFTLRRETSVAHETGEGLSEAMNNLYHAVSEHLSGMKIAKSYGTEAAPCRPLRKTGRAGPAHVCRYSTNSCRCKFLVQCRFGHPVRLDSIYFNPGPFHSRRRGSSPALPLCPCHTEVFGHSTELPILRQLAALFLKSDGAAKAM